MSIKSIVICIPGINREEKLDRHIAGLKPQIRIEVTKTNLENMDYALRIAFNLDRAMFNARMFFSYGYSY